MKILALSGSLREASINSAFCRTAVRLAPAEVQAQVFAGLGHLSLFNPDLENPPPPAVLTLREAVGTADALLIASPEYAHGISAVMKNALDWLVSFEGTVNKPIALVNTSPRARHAYDSLREVLQTMSTQIVEEASITLPLLGACVTEDAMFAAPTVRREIAAIYGALAAHLAGQIGAASFPLG